MGAPWHFFRTKASANRPPGARRRRFRNLQFTLLVSNTPAMSAPQDKLLHAIELALAGKWDAAHEVVQQYEADATAAWIHAVLHKIEGDLGNARYWYRHAGQMSHVADEPRAELITLRTILQNRP